VEKVFVDTSGWVALFVENDRNHRKAVSIYGSLQKVRASLYTSDYVFDETVTTILARGNHAQSVLAGEALLFSEIVKMIFVHPANLRNAWELYKNYKDKKFSFTDVASFSMMKDQDIHKAFSFDQDFAQAGFQVLK